MTNNSNNNNKEISIKRLEPNQIKETDEFINFKTIIVGDSGVGKSSLLKKATQHNFSENYQATIGFEFLLMYYQINDSKIKLQIWDTCGQEMYRSLIQGFYRNTSLTLLIYAVNDEKSFDNLNEWLKDIKNNTERDMPIFLIGNKCDLEERFKIINKNSGEDFARQNNLQYFSESSAKTGYKVDEIFEEVSKYIYKECYLKGKNQLQKLKMGLDKNKADNIENSNKKKKCC